MPKQTKKTKKATAAGSASGYEQARAKYRPKQIKTLFVAEAPPADSSRFFYFEKVRSHDWLFLALMRWHYEEARDLDVDELRAISSCAGAGFNVINEGSIDFPASGRRKLFARLAAHRPPRTVRSIESRLGALKRFR